MLVTAGYWAYISNETQTLETVSVGNESENTTSDEHLGDATLVSNNEVVNDKPDKNNAKADNENNSKSENANSQDNQENNKKLKKHQLQIKMIIFKNQNYQEIQCILKL